MINKILFFLCCFLLITSCSSKKMPVLEQKPLYDIILRKEDGGAKFQFYEIISEKIEFEMIAKDTYISPFLTKEEYKNSNFILVNLGLKMHAGYTIQIQSAIEQKDKIILKILEVAPEKVTTLPTGEFTPNYVIRIKSKKPIEIME